tara:strand:+ start:1740 stop:1979 length:240 start_codon:yes stop_codon:yes gene_type:complete
MDASIKPISDKVGMFASNKELEAELTPKEFSLIKLVKAEEFLEDLYGSAIYPQVNDMFPPKDSYNKIKLLLKELRQLNK